MNDYYQIDFIQIGQQHQFFQHLYLPPVQIQRNNQIYQTNSFNYYYKIYKFYQIITNKLEIQIQAIIYPIYNHLLLYIFETYKIIQMSQVQDFVYDPPTSQQHQHKIFIYEANSLIGHRLVQYFRNDHIIEVNPNIIMGTINPNEATSNELNLNYQIDLKNERLLNGTIVNSQIIIFPLNNWNTQHLQHLLKFLKCLNCKNPKKLIVISSIFQWKLKNNNHFLKKQEFLQRMPIRSIYAELQNLTLGIHNYNSMIKGSVISSGLVYGMGQDNLFSLFKQALQQKQNLKIYGIGNNKIPMIHVDDLCQFTYQIAFSQSNGFFYGVDQGQISQKELITQISRTIGNGKIQEAQIQNLFLHENFDIFNSNFVVDPKSFPNITSWKYRNGFITNIGKIVGQFNTSRGLKPNKILLYGTPASGKTKLAQILKANYGLPLIQIKALIEQIKEQNSPFANEIKATMQEQRAIKIEQQRKLNQQAKKKKKGKGVEDFDPSKVVVKLNDQDVIKIVKRRINMSDCLNKGYIIDSVLKSYQQLEAVFAQNGTINEASFPNSVFFIQGTEQQTKDRVKKLSPAVIEGTHLTQDHTIRRFGVFNKLNESKKWDTFFTNKIQVKNVPFNYSDPGQFIAYIQRNGPLGFKVKPKKQEIKQQPAEQIQKTSQVVKQKDEQDVQQQDAYEEFNLQKLTQNQTKILNEKSRPIRQYLIDNVIPQITEGLLQVCKQVPPDPIKFLINFLETKNNRKKKGISNKM